MELVLAAIFLHAFEKAFEADPVSIFGGIIALNREVDKKTAEKLHEIFLEIIIAPSFTEEALCCINIKEKSSSFNDSI